MIIIRVSKRDEGGNRFRNDRISQDFIVNSVEEPVRKTCRGWFGYIQLNGIRLPKR